MADNRKHISLETLQAFKEEGDVVVDEKIKEASKSVAQNFASEFVPGAVYRPNDYCIYKDILYHRTFEGVEPESDLNPLYWEQVTVMDRVKPLEEEMDTKVSIIDVPYYNIDSVIMNQLPNYCIINYYTGSYYEYYVYKAEWGPNGVYTCSLTADNKKYIKKEAGILSKPLSYLKNDDNYEYIPTELMLSVTWAELKNLRDNSLLVPGMQYRITDYEFTTSATNTASARHQFDIIVTANTKGELSEVARATKHEGDTYFSSSDIKRWKLWYCLDNDANRFDWISWGTGKGVIYRMIDQLDNDCPYDFKNCLFKMTREDTVIPVNTYCYTFCHYQDSTITDRSLSVMARNNTIKTYFYGGDFTSKRKLNNIIIIDTATNSRTDNYKFDNNCYNIIIKHYGSSIFGFGCHDMFCYGSDGGNTFDRNCDNIELINSSGNYFGNGCRYIKMSGSQSNIFEGSHGIWSGPAPTWSYFQDIYNCRIGKRTWGIIFGESSDSLTKEIEFVKIEDGCQYIKLLSSSSSGTTSYTNRLRNVTIHSGIKGTESEYKEIVVPVRGNTYSIDYYAPNSQSITLD